MEPAPAGGKARRRGIRNGVIAAAMRGTDERAGGACLGAAAPAQNGDAALVISAMSRDRNANARMTGWCVRYIDKVK